MDKFNRQWITEKAVPIVNSYSGGLTLRALHYRLVALGMTNTTRHYKRVISAMTKARWDGIVRFSDFQDHERDTLGNTKYEETTVESAVESSIYSIKYWLKNYSKNRWENQPIYPEVFIEKKALQGVFEDPCRRKGVALAPCKGYPSLTFLNEAAERFEDAIREGKEPIILYFGDYDPSGEDIPRSIGDTLQQMGIDVQVKRIALMEHQVIEWGLPPAPAKSGDSRTANWNGLGQVELDAVEPRKLQDMVSDAIDEIFDFDLYEELKEQQAQEKKEYIQQMKDRVNEVFDEEEDD